MFLFFLYRAAAQNKKSHTGQKNMKKLFTKKFISCIMFTEIVIDFFLFSKIF